MHDDLLCELSKAMKSNPDLSILETIEYVLENYDPYKQKYYDMNNIFREEKIFRRPTNSQIYKCLRRYNDRTHTKLSVHKLSRVF